MRVSKRRPVVLSILSLGLLGFAGAAGAQSTYGPTGLFVHPTAFVGPANRFHLYASWFSQDTAKGRMDWLPVSLSYGLSDRAEVGGLYVHNSGPAASEKEHGGGYAKYQLVRDTATRPAFSIVATNLHGEPLETSVVGVLSHAVAANGRTVFTGHLGLKYGRSGMPPTGQDDMGGFIGLEIPVARNLVLAGDVGSRLSFESSVPHGYGLIWTGPREASVRIGFINIGSGGPDAFFIGVGYPLGGVR